MTERLTLQGLIARLMELEKEAPVGTPVYVSVGGGEYRPLEAGQVAVQVDPWGPMDCWIEIGPLSVPELMV